MVRKRKVIRGRFNGGLYKPAKEVGVCRWKRHWRIWHNEDDYHKGLPHNIELFGYVEEVKAYMLARL